MSKPEVAAHVTPRFYMFAYPFFTAAGEAYSLRDNTLLWLLLSPPYLLRLNYCSFDRETVVFKGYAKRFSAAWESCVHAIAFKIAPIDSPNCNTNRLIMGFCADAYWKWCAYFFIFRLCRPASWLWHVYWLNLFQQDSPYCWLKSCTMWDGLSRMCLQYIYMHYLFFEKWPPYCQ